MGENKQKKQLPQNKNKNRSNQASRYNYQLTEICGDRGTCNIIPQGYKTAYLEYKIYSIAQMMYLLMTGK